MDDKSKDRIPALHVAELAEFFSASDRWLFGHARARTSGNRELASALVQDAFEAAARAWDMLRRHSGRRQRAWLLSTLAHKDIGDLRRRETFRSRQPDILASYQPTAADTEAEALNAIAQARAREIIENMPPRQREIALLRWEAHLHNAEIAVLLGIAEGTVHVQLRGARRKLVAGLQCFYPPGQGTVMTPGREPNDPDKALFIVDFYPEFGARLAGQLASGHDAAAAHARFEAWLAAHADDDGAALAAYLASTERIPPLTADEETEYATRVLSGRRAEEKLAEDSDGLSDQARAELELAAQDGVRAGNRLLEANLRIAAEAARQFAARGVPFQDLVDAGARGLVVALQRYDPARGHSFATYAAWWVRQAITRAVAARRRAVLFPEPGAAGDDSLTLTERRVFHALGREPTAEELAAEFDPSAP